MSKKNEKIKMEEELKTMQKHMGGLIKTILDLKHRVETLEKGTNVDHKKEIGEIMEKQNLIDKTIAANVDAIKDIDEEIKTLSEGNNVQKDVIDNRITEKDRKKEEAQKDIMESEIVDAGRTLVRKKCRYFNRGYCKYTSKCRFSHPREICQTYLEGYNCNQRECEKRHPKSCKWIEGSRSCKRQNCAYLHTVIPI